MSTWKELLFDIAATENRRLVFLWTMQNGAAFQMLLPLPSEFKDPAFIDEIEFPFAIEEIAELRTQNSISTFALSRDDLESIRAIACQHTGFDVSINGSLLTIKRS